HSLSEDKRERLQHLIQSGRSVLKAFPASARYQSIIDEIAAQFSSWETYLDLSVYAPHIVATYLFQTFTTYCKLTLSEQADHLHQESVRYLEDRKIYPDFEQDSQN